jgi:subtilisin-like proprotein convertase family protein
MRYVEEFGKAFTAVTPNGAPGGHSEVFSNSDVVDIPDVDPTGITSTIDVPTSGPIQTLLVRVVVAHQGASELGIKLTHADFSVWLSQSSEPGVFVYEASRPPYDRGGPWTIQVSDFGPLAVGQLRGWSVAFD